MAEFLVPPLGEAFDPRGYLIKFLIGVGDVLRETLEEEPGVLLDERYVRAARLAFERVPPTLARMQHRIDELPPSQFEEFGLTGPSLAFKLAVIGGVNDRLRDVTSPPRRRRRGILKKLLEVIDILLESVAKALQIGDLVVEFKKFIESIIPDDLEDR